MSRKQLEILLYFLSNVVLITVGIILIQSGTDSIGGSLVAAGIVGIVMFWALHVNTVRSQKDAARLDLLNRFGILEILPRRLVKEEGDALGNKASSAMDIIGFGLKSFYEDTRDSQLVKVASRAQVRILVVDPNHAHCSQGDYEERKNLGNTREEVIALTRFIQQLNHPKVKLRWYSAIPSVHLLRADNEMLVGPYLIDLVHRNTYCVRLGNGQLFDYYLRHFETVWSDPNLSCEPDLSLV